MDVWAVSHRPGRYSSAGPISQLMPLVLLYYTTDASRGNMFGIASAHLLHHCFSARSLLVVILVLCAVIYGSALGCAVVLLSFTGSCGCHQL